MIPIYITAEQGSEEWLLARCGRANASEFSAVLAKGQGKVRATYLRRVLAERFTGKPIATNARGAMKENLDRGEHHEPYAKLAYSARERVIVNDVGYAKHPEIMAGCSPDGLVGDDGGIEAKSVIATTQLETVLAGGYPQEHKPQIQGNIWITGRSYWDFVSYCPEMPPKLRLYVYRVLPDNDYLRTLEAEVRVFLREIDDLYAKLMENQ